MFHPVTEDNPGNIILRHSVCAINCSNYINIKLPVPGDWHSTTLQTCPAQSIVASNFSAEINTVTAHCSWIMLLLQAAVGLLHSIFPFSADTVGWVTGKGSVL